MKEGFEAADIVIKKGDSEGVLQYLEGVSMVSDYRACLIRHLAAIENRGIDAVLVAQIGDGYSVNQMFAHDGRVFLGRVVLTAFFSIVRHLILQAD